jgi:HAMP domain-containing protein
MIVICEDCGKKYQIDPAKIKGEQARFKCKACDAVITVKKPRADSAEPAVKAPRPVPPPPPRPPEPVVSEGVAAGPEPDRGAEAAAEVSGPAEERGKRRFLGLRGKMIGIFFFIPIVLIAASGVLYIWQLKTLTDLMTGQSSKVVRNMAEDIIAESARATAKQCALYLSSHSGLRRENYNSDPAFKEVAVQKVGLTGYTALYELPGSDGVWRTWAHVNAKIIGIDMSKLKKPLGRNFPGFWKVYTGVQGGKESRGYYTWQDKDGSFREKFMVCTPVEGTRYIVASTTYLDEFTKPIKMMETRAQRLGNQTRNIIVAILGGTIILIGVIVSIYGHSMTGKIKTLTETADRISVGELDAEVAVKSKDEIGELADAISRMQESIRLSIERLRRRR